MSRALGMATVASLALIAGGCARAASVTRARGPLDPRTWQVGVAVDAGRAEHIVDAGEGRTATAGSTFGLGMRASPTSWMEVNVRAANGSLTGAGPTLDHDLAESSVDASFLILPWLAGTMGGSARKYTGALATQRWMSLRTGAELRLPLANGAARGIVRAHLMPRVSIIGFPQPTLALGTATGVELRRGRLYGSVIYGLDRYDFAEEAGVARRERFGSLSIQAGYRFGRR